MFINFYFFLIIRSTLKCASLVWYSVTSTDSKRTPSQSKETCSSLLQPIFSPYSKVHSSCNDIQIFLFNTLQVRRQKLHANFVINIFLDHKPCASSLVSAFPLGSSETSLCFVLVQPSKFTPQPGVPMQKIQFLVIFKFSEGKISHPIRFYIFISLLL